MTDVSPGRRPGLSWPLSSPCLLWSGIWLCTLAWTVRAGHLACLGQDVLRSVKTSLRCENKHSWLLFLRKSAPPSTAPGPLHLGPRSCLARGLAWGPGPSALPRPLQHLQAAAPDSGPMQDASSGCQCGLSAGPSGGCPSKTDSGRGCGTRAGRSIVPGRGWSSRPLVLSRRVLEPGPSPLAV